MSKQTVIFEDLGQMGYQQAWDYQEELLRRNVGIKTALRETGSASDASLAPTTHHLLLVEHPPVYTLGKSGHLENLLLGEEERAAYGIQFFKTNRGGDITFHGPGQIVGYPVLDLEKFYTDIGRYLRELEEVIIDTLASFDIHGERSVGETGVWIEPGIQERARKICAMGVRCSRWITMHGFALNVNTDLSYFSGIIPCGIQNKQVTSMENEIGSALDMELVKARLKLSFEKIFNCRLS